MYTITKTVVLIIFVIPIMTSQIYAQFELTFVSDATWNSQHVCLNASNPRTCPSDAILYNRPSSGWRADLSSIPGANWIWAPGITGDSPSASLAQFSFQKTFHLPGIPLSGSISVAADDFAEIVINGNSAGIIGSITNKSLASVAQTSLHVFDVTTFLLTGNNTIKIVGRNGPEWFGGGSTYNGNPAGVVFGGLLVSTENLEINLTGSIELLEKDGAILPGQERAISITLQNDGVPVSGSLTSKIYLSANSSLDSNDINLSQRTDSLDSFTGEISFTDSITLESSELAGLSSFGTRHLLLKIDINNDITEENEDDNISASSGFWMGQVINVLTHGFNPTPPDLPLFGASWEDFRKDWFEIAKTLRNLPEEGTLLYDPLGSRIATHLAEWDSSTGFLQAFTNLIMAKIADAKVQDIQNHITQETFDSDMERITSIQLKSIKLKALAEGFAKKSRDQATTAALRIIRYLEQYLLIENISLSNQYQVIQLIGHSRGAAVNAIVSRIMQSKGYEIDQYIALDGFSTDWPDDGGIIGDTDISARTIAMRKINYRVQKDLATFIVDEYENNLGSAANLVDEIAAVLSTTPQLSALALLIAYINIELGTDISIASELGNSDIRNLLRETDIRAPFRFNSGFHDILFFGPNSSTKSVHTNITSIYLQSGDRDPDTKEFIRQPSERYILDNFIGNLRSMAIPIGGIASSSPNIVQSTPLLNSKKYNQLKSTPRANPENIDISAEFVDGGFEQVRGVHNEMQSIAKETTGSELIDAWFQSMSSQKSVLSSRWELSGNVQLIIETDNALVELTQTHSTSIGQNIRLDHSYSSVNFDYSMESPGIDDKLQVVFNDQIIDEFMISDLSPNGSITTPSQCLKSFGKLEFKITGPIDNPAVIRIDNIVINPETPPTQDLDLEKGWNHVGFYVEPDDMTFETVFDNLITSNRLEKVFGENKKFERDLAVNLTPLRTLKCGVGYWIKVNEPSTISVSGCPMESSAVISLKAGWNDIGFTLQQDTDIEVALADLITNGNLIRVVRGDKNYDPLLPDSLNTLDILELGLAYWIYVSNDQDFSFK